MARVFTDAGAMALASIAGQGKLFDNGGVGSWAVWVYRTAAPAAERGLVGMGDFTTDVGWWVNLTTTGLINAIMPFATANRVRVSTTATTLNAWTHVIITSSGRGTASTGFTFYINGKPEAGTQTTAGAGAAPIDGSFAAKIGPGPGTAAAANTTAPPANIGPVAYWDRVLTDPEALALACGAHPLRFRPGLRELWSMDGGLHEPPTLGKAMLLAGATVPANSQVNPPIEPPPVALLNRQRLNPRPRSYFRARYFETVAAGGIVGLAGLGSLVITGFAPSGNIGGQPGVGSLAVTSFAPSAQVSTVAGLGQLTINGFAGQSAIATVPGLGQIVINGQAPAGVVGTRGQAGVGALAISGFAPSSSIGATGLPGTGQLAIAGFAPQANISGLAGLGQVVITGYAPVVPAQIVGQPGSADVTITSYAPIGVGGRAIFIQVGAADTTYTEVTEGLAVFSTVSATRPSYSSDDDGLTVVMTEVPEGPPSSITNDPPDDNFDFALELDTDSDYDFTLIL